ncbi:MAG: 1-acyl-sn-glycerol-3-phosphate acyltransferase [Anaerolineaceae bacterium]|nr:1-acyl-sn-glycerol-3-phosphate acyltransferase [Anaerolineaceae bacterium]
MKFSHKLVNAGVKGITRTLCRIDPAQFEAIPMDGPLICIENHINAMEAPIIVTQFLPRRIRAVSKVETWDNSFYRFLFNTWGGIPLRMGEADLNAFAAMKAALESGEIVGLAPEGTRSHDGKLQKGYPGTVLLAVRSGAPIMPIAHYGIEEFWQNLKRLKRTDFNIVVGNPFKINTHGEAMSRPVREQMAAEMMYQLAALLPPEYRGLYADFRKATSKYLQFENEADNNLLRVKDSLE